MEIHDLLFTAFGSQNWWPAETDLEMMIGAILTQNTSWSNVEKAIQNLKEKDLVSIKGLSDTPAPILAEYIRPAGYYNLKVRRLKNLISLIHDKHNGDLNSLLSLDTETIRKELLSVKGIGLETADSMILYAAGRALFVVDTYTHRILSRHGLIEEEAGYFEVQMLFMDTLPHDVELFKEFHALLVKTGKDFCRRKPLCPDCPLEKVNREA
ncbi:MAG: endonuclease III domain-containing protein [Deltaproteobacteria bacterium]|nr:endonuclease III domain-containing protein [Deltaproteobacteria bacterium]MBW2342136.1 endonuclease III domain-containing protein [Deltaproteobacteria bacterium]